MNIKSMRMVRRGGLNTSQEQLCKVSVAIVCVGCLLSGRVPARVWEIVFLEKKTSYYKKIYFEFFPYKFI